MIYSTDIMGIDMYKENNLLSKNKDILMCNGGDGSKATQIIRIYASAIIHF